MEREISDFGFRIVDLKTKSQKSGVRIQEEKNIKSVLSFWLLAADYVGFCDLNDLNNGRRSMRFARADFADAAWPDT